MNKKDSTRRKLLKRSIAIPCAVSLLPKSAFSSPSKDLTDSSTTNKLQSMNNLRLKEDQINYMVTLLKRYTRNSNKVSDTDLRNFASGFIDLNGLKNYRNEFSGVSGEYKLAKFLIQSVHMGQV